MLAANPVAVVTPFTGGNVRLPKESDLERISARTSELYCTAVAAGKPPTREPAVEKSMRRPVADRRLIEGKPGHVRIRLSATDKAEYQKSNCSRVHTSPDKYPISV
jgi:hypothetical protein